MLACSLFHRILSVWEASNRGTNALPILSQAMAGETECCDLEQLSILLNLSNLTYGAHWMTCGVQLTYDLPF
jgi:hypothetical protein